MLRLDGEQLPDQSPSLTIGTDYKMTLTLFDASCQHNGRVKFVIFRPSEEEMPQIDNANDVVLIVAAKVGLSRIEPRLRAPTDMHP